MVDGQFDYRAVESDGRVLDREKLGDRVFELLQKLDAGKAFSDEESKRKFIEGLSFDDYKKLLVFINGNLRELPKDKRVPDGEDVHVADYIPPRQEDKDALLGQSFNAMQTMSAEGRDMADIATLGSISINSLHMFGDGNGRTSRLEYYLLAQDHPNLEAERQEINTILGVKGHRMIDLNTYSIGRYIDGDIGEKHVGLDANDPLSPELFTDESHYRDKLLVAIAHLGKDNVDLALKLIHIIDSREGFRMRHGFMAVAKYLQNKGQITDYLEIFSDEKGPYSSAIKIEEVLSSLSTEDAQQIIDNYWEIKRIFISELIGLIARPDEFVYHNGHSGEDTTLLEILREYVDHNVHLDRLKSNNAVKDIL